MESTGKMDAIKEGGRNIGFRLLVILKIAIVGLAIIGTFTAVTWVSAFFSDGGLEPVEAVNVENITSILVDEDGDVVFDYQIVVNSAAAFKDIKSGEVFLSVVGDLSTPEQ